MAHGRLLQMRVIWYVLNAITEDEETQRKGIVGVKSNFGEFARCEPFSLLKYVDRVLSGIPKKIVVMHYLYDNPSHKAFVQGAQLFLPRSLRTRFRRHFGDHENLIFELQTYGIPTEHHPILPDGSLSLEYHKEWLKNRRMQEESASSGESDGDKIVILPRRFDVLLGRGKYTREHTGNLRAVHLVEMHRSEYEQAGKFGKTIIAERILHMIHNSRGRFLKWENHGWIEVDEKVARDKISHFFRHLRSKTLTSTSGKNDDSSATEVSTGSNPSDPSSTAAKRNIPDESSYYEGSTRPKHEWQMPRQNLHSTSPVIERKPCHFHCIY